MHPGDFVLTPYWCWHDHGHTGTEPVIWLDALDNPFAQMFGTMFRENYPHEAQAVYASPPATPRRATARACFRSNIAPRNSPRRCSPTRTTARARRSHQLARRRPAASRPRHQDALRQSDDRRPRLSDHLGVHPVAAEEFAGQTYRSTESVDLLRGRRNRARRTPATPTFSFRAARRLRRAELDSLPHRNRRRMRAVLVFRSRAPGSARLVAR